MSNAILQSSLTKTRKRPDFKYQDALSMLDRCSIDTFDNVANLRKLYPDLDCESLLKDRKDPRRYLSILTSRPSELLELMYTTSTMLIGPRAAEYFVPGTCNTDCPWTFYCGGGQHVLVAMYKWLKELNFYIDDKEPKATYTRDETGEVNYCQTIVGKSIANGTVHSVRILAYSTEDDISMLVKQWNSINQCMIAGYGAISLQHAVNKQGKHFDISVGIRPSTCPEYALLEVSGLRNNILPDIKKISYKETSNYPGISAADLYGTRYRRLSDEGVYVVNYGVLDYLSDEYRKDADGIMTTITKTIWTESNIGIGITSSMTPFMGNPDTTPYSMHIGLIRRWLKYGILSIERHKSDYSIESNMLCNEAIPMNYTNCKHTDTKNRTIDWLIIRNDMLRDDLYMPQWTLTPDLLNADVKVSVYNIVNCSPQLTSYVREAGLIELHKCLERMCLKCKYPEGVVVPTTQC